MDLFSLITFGLGGIAVILIVLYLIFHFSKKDKEGIKSAGKGNASQTEEELFDYLVKEAEISLDKGNSKEVSSIYNRLNHVYLYINKDKKVSAKKKLDEIYEEIKQLK